MKQIRVGVIGAGRMGITHLAILKSDPRVELTGIADTGGMVLDLLGRYLKCAIYKDYRALFSAGQLDAVVVCTPPDSHFEIVKEALARRVHVFAEKPFTLSARLAFELADGFERSGLVNQVGYVNRFNDVFVRVRELLRSGLIGSVIRYRTEMFSRTVVRKGDGSGWRGSHSSGGGATYEMASHAVDLVNFFLAPPDSVSGTAMTRVFSKAVEDIVSATFSHAKGPTGTLLVNWSDESVRKPTNKLEFFGDRGKITADQHGARIYLRESNAEAEMHDGWNALNITDVFKKVPFYVRGNEYTRQIYHFLDNVSGSFAAGHCSFRHAAQTLETIEAMFAQAQPGGPR